MGKKTKAIGLLELRNSLSSVIRFVVEGGMVVLTSHNTPVARIVPEKEPSTNRTQLGCGQGSLLEFINPTDPFLLEDDWEMLK